MFLAKLDTVDEKIMVTTKIRNNYGAITIAILDFSLLFLVKLSLLILFASFWYQFFAYFFMASFLLLFLKAIAIRLSSLFTNAFKIIKERQLYGKPYIKEAINLQNLYIQKFKQS